MLNDITFDLPSGPGNLSGLFPSLNFKDIDQYRLTLRDTTTAVVCTTPTHKMTKEWVAPAMKRLHFLNYLGRYDSIAFHVFSQSNDIKSGDWTRPLPSDPAKTDYGTARTDIVSRDGWIGKHYSYGERSQPWLQELFESPLAFMELPSFDGQPPSYIPVVIVDRTTIPRKEEERWVYETIVEWKAANTKIGLKI